MCIGLAAIGAVTVAAQGRGPDAQGNSALVRSITLSVTETAGIRRTEYPVSVTLPLPRAGVTDVAHLRLRAGDSETPVQFTPGGTWDDGSLKSVEVDFNATVGAGESQEIRLEYGASVSSETKLRNGLNVTDSPDAIQISNIRLGRSGWPLLASVSYRGEIIGPGPNGLVLVDASGNRYEFGAATAAGVQVVKRGPLLVSVRYTGHVAMSGGDVGVTITCELPNSKSWIKLTAEVDDPARRVRGLFFETPFALGAFPWTWDFGTDSGTYGAFRGADEQVMLTQLVAPGNSSWHVDTGTAASSRVYERSLTGRATTAGGWGHLQDARNVIAFAMDRFASTPGEYRIALDAQGHARFGRTSSQSAASQQLILYQHYVSTPVAIGAATSPTAMARRLEVKVLR